MKTHHVIFAMSMTAMADLEKNRFIGLDGNPCGAGAKSAGVGEFDVAAGEQATVNAMGAIIVESGGAVSAGSAVESDADARAVTHGSGEINGYALNAAATAGEHIVILRGI